MWGEVGTTLNCLYLSSKFLRFIFLYISEMNINNLSGLSADQESMLATIFIGKFSQKRKTLVRFANENKFLKHKLCHSKGFFLETLTPDRCAHSNQQFLDRLFPPK